MGAKHAPRRNVSQPVPNPHLRVFNGEIEAPAGNGGIPRSASAPQPPLPPSTSTVGAQIRGGPGGNPTTFSPHPLSQSQFQSSPHAMSPQQHSGSFVPPVLAANGGSVAQRGISAGSGIPLAPPAPSAPTAGTGLGAPRFLQQQQQHQASTQPTSMAMTSPNPDRTSSSGTHGQMVSFVLPQVLLASPFSLRINLCLGSI